MCVAERARLPSNRVQHTKSDKTDRYENGKLCECATSSAKYIHQFQYATHPVYLWKKEKESEKNLWDGKMNVKCAYIFGRFLCPFLSLSRTTTSESHAFAYTLRLWIGECVSVFEICMFDIKSDRVLALSLWILWLKYILHIYFDLTETQRIYHLLDPIRCDRLRMIVQEMEWLSMRLNDRNRATENGLTFKLIFLFNQSAIRYLLLQMREKSNDKRN